MKVSMMKDWKNLLTVSESEKAREVIADMKNDESKPADYAKIAANVITRRKAWGQPAIVSASAEICKNCNAWNRYTEDSEHIDVLISFIADCGCDGFVRGSVPLSEIWDITGSDYQFKNAYIRTYSAD